MSHKASFLLLKIVYIIGLCLVIVSCKKNYPSYDIVPYVKYISAITDIDSSDKKLTLTFQLHDGDGNVGLAPEDTVEPYIDSFQQNFYADIFSIRNEDTTLLPYTVSYRIPQIRSSQSNKFIKADVSINFSFPKSVFAYDTILMRYFIFDRDLNKSNIDTSDAIIFLNE